MKKLLFVLIPFFLELYAVNIGSDTAVTRFNTQQILNNTDRVAEFAALYGGFALADAQVTGRFDSIFQVSGNVSLNAGNLILDQDLILFNNVYFNTLGNIVGQGHVLEFNYTSTSLPILSAVEASCFVYLADQKTTIVNKDIYSLDWSVADTFLAVGFVSGPGNQLEIWEWNGTNALTYKSGLTPKNRTVYSVRWHPTKGWLAVGMGSGGGPSELFIYSVNWTTGVLTLLSSANFGGDVTALAWHPTGNYLAVGGTTNGSEVRVYPVSGVGILGTAVTFNTGSVDVSQRDGIDWDSAGEYLAVALELSGGNPEVRILRFGTTPSLSLTQVANINKTVAVFAVDWHPTLTSVFAIGLNTSASVSSEIYNVDVYSGSTTLLNQIAGINATTQTLDWAPSGRCLALGTSAPNTNEFRIYSFDTNTFKSVFSSGYDRGSDSVTAVRWSRTTNSLAVGGFDNIIYIYKNAFAPSVNPSDINGTGALNRCFTWSDVGVVLNNDIVLNGYCILFSGNSYIDGKDHCLWMTPDSRIFLDKKATLLMKNLTIKGIKNNIIGAFDDLSTFSLNNVEWSLDGNYTFTKGRLDVVGDFIVSGSGNTFSYKSQATSKIYEHGNMIVDKDAIFSYEPVTANRDLIQLTNSSSELTLRGATLHSTTTGIRLTKGIVTVDYKSTIASDGQIESTGISFGNGTQSANNVKIQILPAATMDIVGGCVVYNDA